MDMFGRQKMCLVTNIPFAIAWVMHYFATDIWYIYIARIIAGFTSGVCSIIHNKCLKFLNLS